MRPSLLLWFSFFLLAGCFSKAKKETLDTPTTSETQKKTEKTLEQNTTRLHEIPVLCYHGIGPIYKTDSPNKKTYTVTPKAFAEQMKALADGGYHTILPDALYGYLTRKQSLPKNPILITFDDSRAVHFSIAAKEMKRYGFKGVFFVMTVTLNKSNYLTTAEIKSLSDDGNVIGCHTWDHHMVTKYAGTDWDLQLKKPKAQLERITGKPVRYFAYPFGVWNTTAIDSLKANGYQLAFILSGKKDKTDSLFTVRRMIVAGSYNTEAFLKGIQRTFK